MVRPPERYRNHSEGRCKHVSCSATAKRTGVDCGRPMNSKATPHRASAAVLDMSGRRSPHVQRLSKPSSRFPTVPADRVSARKEPLHMCAPYIRPGAGRKGFKVDDAPSCAAWGLAVARRPLRIPGPSTTDPARICNTLRTLRYLRARLAHILAFLWLGEPNVLHLPAHAVRGSTVTLREHPTFPPTLSWDHLTRRFSTCWRTSRRDSPSSR